MFNLPKHKIQKSQFGVLFFCKTTWTLNWWWKRVSQLTTLTFVHHKLAVFVIVEQDLLLIWSGHEDDLIPQSLPTHQSSRLCSCLVSTCVTCMNKNPSMYSVCVLPWWPWPSWAVPPRRRPAALLPGRAGRVCPAASVRPSCPSGCTWVWSRTSHPGCQFLGCWPRPVIGGK